MNVNVLWTIIITENQITRQEALKENTNIWTFSHICAGENPPTPAVKVNWNKVLQNAWTLPVLEDNISLETPFPPHAPQKMLTGETEFFFLIKKTSNSR